MNKYQSVSRRKSPLPRQEDWHPIVLATRDRLEFFRNTYDDRTYESPSNCLDLGIAPKLYIRALYLLEAVIRKCEARGWKVAVQDCELLTITVDQTDVPLRFDEKYDSIVEEKPLGGMTLRRRRHHRNGLLFFRIEERF